MIGVATHTGAFSFLVAEAKSPLAPIKMLKIGFVVVRLFKFADESIANKFSLLRISIVVEAKKTIWILSAASAS